ncbi:MAG: FAD-dependent oxidoreductase [Pseudomonadota bacterium]
MHSDYDIIIIGGGPAGSAAAAFVSRCKWNALVIDKSMSAGFLGSLSNVSYFPGFPESISGLELLKRMRRQAELVGTSFVSDAATQLSGTQGAFKIITQSGKGFQTKAIVVATGASARTNYLQGERELLGRGVSYDVLADGPAVAKRTAAIVGKTEQAAREALALARFADHIHFIIPSNKIEANDETLKMIRENKSIETHFSASLKKINGADHVKSITVFSNGQEKEIAVVGVFTYVHEYKATTDFLKDEVEISQTGTIKVDNKLATATEGVFACGDVLCGKPQIPSIAASQGLLAGISAHEFLSAERI